MTAAAAVVVAVALMLGFVWVTQRQFIYFPTRGVPTPLEGLTDVEPVAFETIDGLHLSGWFVKASGSAPHVTVMVFNGNAGNRAHRSALAIALRRHGWHTFLMDYRGFGGNPGTPSETGLAADSRAARAFLVGRPDVDPARLVYFGESLGTAVAVDLAAEHPPAALILRSPFTSMVDLAVHHYPFLPVRLLLQDRFASIDKIGKIRAPLLVIAGARDRIVPIDSSRRLYAAAPGPKTMLVIPDADHNDRAFLAGDGMISAIGTLLETLR